MLVATPRIHPIKYCTAALFEPLSPGNSLLDARYRELSQQGLAPHAAGQTMWHTFVVLQREAEAILGEVVVLDGTLDGKLLSCWEEVLHHRPFCMRSLHDWERLIYISRLIIDSAFMRLVLDPL